MRYYLIAGEASGDLHASNLAAEIKLQDPNAQFRGLGGDRMKEQGVELLRHYSDTAYMGFAEVIIHLRAILKNIDNCRKDIIKWKPDCVILIDYPGFNLRIAPYVKAKGFKVFYYISPQLWAWKSSRVEIIKKYVDRLFVILPFEKEFYQKFKYDVEYVGHPLLDEINKKLKRPDYYSTNHLSEKPIIAILPGSRKQEIRVKLPVMLKMAEKFPAYQFVVACAPSIEREFYNNFLSAENIHYLQDQTYDILQHSFAALVTSGTATLETALFGVPEVVCYKGSAVSYLIARQLVKVKYISLVNLIMDSEVVPELIQFDFTEDNLYDILKRILEDEQYRNEMKRNYSILRDKLGNTGASFRTAFAIVRLLSN